MITSIREIEGRKKGKIDIEVFIQVYGKTQDQALAYEKAGGECKNKDDSVRQGGRLLKKLSQDLTKKGEEQRKTIITLLREKQRKILESITPEELENAPLNQKVISLGIITDKLQLLENKPTSIMEIAPKMVFDGDTVEFKRLSQTEQKQLAPVEEGITKDISADDGL